ncbi:MAG TPA: hypothetical protein PKH93_14465, partial [Chitinophagales bacterium]|nr:hypothetical protein [Chitinophagales bacterium]
MRTIIFLYTLSFLLLLNNNNCVLAQTKYFETSFNWYPTTANQNGVKIQEYSNGQYMIGGLVNNYMPFFWNNCSLIVDKEGQLISINEYQADTALFEGTGLYDMLPTEYGYIMAGFVNDATGMVNSLCYLVRIDTMGLLIDQTVLA